MEAPILEHKAKIPNFTLGTYVPEQHYFKVVTWWKKHGKDGPKADVLSDLGLIALDENLEPIAITWLYVSNSRLGNIGFTVCDPEAPPKKKVFGVSYVIEQAIAAAKFSGLTSLHSFSSAPGLTKLFLRKGFDKLEAHDFLMGRFEEG